MRHSLALVALVLTPVQLSAQRWLTLEAGGGALEHQFAPPSQAVSLAPHLTWVGQRARFDGGLVYSRGTALGWNAEAVFETGLTTGLTRHWSLGLDAGGAWTAHQLGDGTRELRILPSLRLDGRVASLGLAIGGGQAWTSAGGEFFLRGALDGTTQAGPLDIHARVSRTRFSDRVLRATGVWVPNGEFGDTLLRRYISSYDDIELRAGWNVSRFRLEGGLLRRIGIEQFKATGWHVEGTAWLTPKLAVFGAGGRTLSHLTVDLPARAYTTIGLRWMVNGPKVPLPALPPLSAAGFRAERVGALVRLVLPAPHAASVEVTGDFSDWEPLPMRQDSEGWWTLTRTLAPGLYRVNVRIDGGGWRVPAGLPAEQDGYGGQAGLLLVP
jgi:Carbohydrate-binding module 48 (Isoamylase N-terminal domain)